MTDVHPIDARALAADRELYLTDQAGLFTSVAELQEAAYKLAAIRATRMAEEMHLLLTQISRAHASGLPKSTRERIAAVLA